MALFHSSVIVTGAAIDTRTRDTLQFSFLGRPQAMTAYIQFVELTAVASVGGNSGIFAIGSLANGATDTRFTVYRGSAAYNLDWDRGPAGVTTSVSAASVVVGDLIELRASISITGVATLGMSRNRGTETVGTPTLALAFPTEWTSRTILVNAFTATTQGCAAYRNIEIVQGTRTLQQMRVLAGTD